MINQPAYNIDPKKIENVIQIPSRIVTRTYRTQYTNTTSSVQFNLGMEDNLPKYIKIKNVQIQTTNNGSPYYIINLPNLCNFDINLPGCTNVQELNITALAGFEYFFSNYTYINDTQILTISGNGNAFTIYIYLTFEFYY